MTARTYPEFSTNYPLLLTTFMKRPVRYYPDQIGVVYRNHVTGDYQRFTWRQWYRRICQLAHALGDDLKIVPGKPGQPGDRVGTMAYNTHRHLELYYAVPCTGAILHAINIRLSDEHIVHTINHAQDKIIFVDDVVMPLLERIHDRIKDTVKLFVYMSDKPGLPASRIPNLIEYEKLIARHPQSFEWPYLHEDTIATLCYTSGTTGQPKGAMFTHRQLYLMSLHRLARHNMINTPAFAEADRLGENAVHILNTPFFHVHGWGAPYHTIFCAQKVVLAGTFTARGFCELVEREKVTTVGIVPTIAAMLVEFKDLDKYDLSSLISIGVGGGALPLGLKTKLEQVLPHLRAGSGYGMTETAPAAIAAFLKKHMVDWPKEAVDEVMVKTGLPSLGLEIEVVDEKGRPVPWDNQTVGEIVIRGPWVMKEYYKAPESTAAAWRDGWFHSGDIAKVDEEGFITIADRLKDVIRSGAEMVPTVLLENLISMADFVLEATVVGVPDSMWGEKPLAIVSLRPGMQASEDDIVEFLAEHGVKTGKITKWMLPKLVAIVDEIPKTSVGKYNKKVVRDNLDRFLSIAKDTTHHQSG